LTVHNAATGHHALVIATVWWPIGMALAAVYFVFSYRMFFRAEPKAGVDGY
jgi:cytochrome d ubiquinol oxidase subunit II